MVTGASRGLGLEFTKQYLKEGNRVFACSRKPDRYLELQEKKSKHEEKLVL